MIKNAKKIITALGLPIIQAPSEGEAQTAYMVKQGDAYASISQDYDNLIFGCPTLIRNLSIEGKRKRMGKFAYQIVKPEIILLKNLLEENNINRDQLIVLAILVGTDYNPEGIKGIGQKKALKLIKEYGTDFDTIFKQVEWDNAYPDLSWKTLFDTIKDIPVTDNYDLEWKNFDEDELKEMLVKEFEFSRDRVNSKLEKLKKTRENMAQTGLNKFF